MKQPKLHTGTFHCPECCVEFDLLADPSLKCEECGGPLIRGTLEESWDAEDSDDPRP